MSKESVHHPDGESARFAPPTNSSRARQHSTLNTQHLTLNTSFNIAFYCPLDFASLSGVPVLAATLARALAERGHRIEIFARGANPELGVAFRALEAWDPAGFDV